MKTLKQIREQYDQITEKEENEERKLVSLVRSGLVDTNKLPLIKRALNKDNRILTPSERNALMSLLDSLMAQVLHSNPVYQKVKQNVMKEELRPSTNRMSDMPSILVLKRRAIRVYPGGQNVGLYYSQQLNKFVAVPFGDSKDMVTMMEEESVLNEMAVRRNTSIRARRRARNARTPTNDLQKTHNEIMNSTVGKDVFKQAGKDNYIGHLAGREIYRQIENRKSAAVKATPTKVAPVTEENVDEMYAALARGVVAAGSAIAKNAPRLGSSIMKRLRGGKSPKPKKPGKPGKPKRRKFDADDVAAAAADSVSQNTNNNTGGSNQQQSAQPKISPTGTNSRLQVRTSDITSSRILATDKDSARQSYQPQRKQNVTNESVEIDLNGNKFQLNNIVAKKVQTVYESLNKINKKKMVDMMNESEESFNKVISFVVRH